MFHDKRWELMDERKQMEKGLVSAIVTTHNRKELLLKAIQSILGQTYEKIECIVIDDASIDGTRNSIEHYTSNGLIRYFYIEPKDSKGGNYARNLGIQNAKGEYIAFCDDDDEWFSTKIEKQVKTMQSEENIGFVYCGMLVEKNFDSKTRISRPNQISKFLEGDLSTQILTRIITTTTTMMIKTDLLRSVGGFDEKLKYWQEYELCIRVLQNTKAKAVKENLVLYRNLTKDKNRLSNKILGWEQAVKYIEIKHKNLIEQLSEDENAIRMMYIYIDGFIRGYNAKSPKYMIKYLFLMLSNRKVRKMTMSKIYKKVIG